MDKSTSVDSTLDPNASVLKTTFVTQEQTAALMQILDLALEDIEQVGGGLARAGATCSCVNCCSHAKAVAF
jgi:hypothetical protein